MTRSDELHPFGQRLADIALCYIPSEVLFHLRRPSQVVKLQPHFPNLLSPTISFIEWARKQELGLDAILLGCEKAGGYIRDAYLSIAVESHPLEI